MDFPLTGDRLLLRIFEAGDLAAVNAIYSDPEVMRWVATGPVQDPAESAAMLAAHAEHQRVHGFSCWAVIERGSGAVIGDAGLMTRGGEVEVGYTLAADRWGRGYGTEAARLCVEAAFGPLDLDALIAIVRPENAASAAVLTKLGFQPDGHLTAYGTAHRRYRLGRQQSCGGQSHH